MNCYLCTPFNGMDLNFIVLNLKFKRGYGGIGRHARLRI